jgi:hypothetical protein
MKTITSILTSIILLLSMISFAEKNEFFHGKEFNINDIPFNTNFIAVNYVLDNDEYNSFPLEAEEYVDDITFNTSEIASYYLRSKTEIVLEDETYIDDIPFNTWKLFNEYYLDQLALNNENYVNDIPFNTRLIAADYLVNSTELTLSEEAYVDDIPDYELIGLFTMNPLAISGKGCKNIRVIMNKTDKHIVIDTQQFDLIDTRNLEEKAEKLRYKICY